MVGPHLWIKLEHQHKITTTGAKWEPRFGPREIEADEIFVIAAPLGRSEYIVTLVHEEAQENPVVLGMGPLSNKYLS